MKMLTLALSCLTLSSAFAATQIDQLICVEECSGALTLTFHFDDGTPNGHDETAQGHLPKLNCQNAYDYYHPGIQKSPHYKLIVRPSSKICKLTTKSRQTQKKTSH